MNTKALLLNLMNHKGNLLGFNSSFAGQIRGTAGLPGSGVGKGGGGGGAVRESGGGLGQYGAAQEDGYFHKMQREQLKKIKEKLDSGESEMSQKEKENK